MKKTKLDRRRPAPASTPTPAARLLRVVAAVYVVLAAALFALTLAHHVRLTNALHNLHGRFLTGSQQSATR